MTTSITILLVTVWMHVGGQQAASAFTIQAQDYEECQADSPATLALFKKEGFKVAGKKIPVEKISGICLTIEKPVEA